jgi:large subunit ribosomal protein L10
MATQAKIDEVALLKGKFEEATSIVLADYRGLTANEMVELRRAFRGAGLEYRVVKDTLARIAAREVGLDDLAELFAGPIAVALGYDDPAAAFKVTERCRKTYQPRYTPRGGLFEGALVREAEFARYATLPSREELLGRLAGLCAAPVRALAVVLQAKVRELAVVLSEVHKQLEEKKGEDQ